MTLIRLFAAEGDSRLKLVQPLLEVVTVEVQQRTQGRQPRNFQRRSCYFYTSCRAWEENVRKMLSSDLNTLYFHTE